MKQTRKLKLTQNLRQNLKQALYLTRRKITVCQSRRKRIKTKSLNVFPAATQSTPNRPWQNHPHCRLFRRLKESPCPSPYSITHSILLYTGSKPIKAPQADYRVYLAHLVARNRD